MSSTAGPDFPSVCIADDATFWPWLSWPRFESMAGKGNRVVVVPVAGMADWGLGHPFDAEETLLTTLIKGACPLVPEGKRPLVIPPLRFVFGADPGCVFSVEQPATHALLADVAASIAAAGFRKIVFVNASPWNEELLGAAGRDLRVAKGLHIFQIHLSALGFDLHPVRSTSRRTVQTLLTALYGVEPEACGADTASTAGGWGEERVTRLPGPAASLGEAQREAGEALPKAAARLAALLGDIADRAPLTERITPV
jgi:creatinine amidohydrolase